MRGGARVFICFIITYTEHFLQQGKIQHSYHLLPLTTQEQKLHPLKSGKRKRCDVEDPHVRDSQLSTYNQDTSQSTYASEDNSSPVAHSPNEEEHNKRQHKPENEDQHLLKLKLIEMADQRFLDFIHRKLLS